MNDLPQRHVLIESDVNKCLQGVTVNLKLVPPPDESPTLIERIGNKLSESAKYVLIGFLLLCVPLGVYNFAVETVGYHIAVHWGFGSGLVCMLISAYLLFFSGWFMELEW